MRYYITNTKKENIHVQYTQKEGQTKKRIIIDNYLKQYIDGKYVIEKTLIRI
jgi:hypothetical protein